MHSTGYFEQDSEGEGKYRAPEALPDTSTGINTSHPYQQLNNSNNCGPPDSQGEVIVDTALPGTPPEKKKYLVNCDTVQGSQVLSSPETNSSPSDCTVISILQAQPRQFDELLQCKPPPLYRESPKKFLKLFFQKNG